MMWMILYGLGCYIAGCLVTREVEKAQDAVIEGLNKQLCLQAEFIKVLEGRG
jgi:hypothetical protein